MKSPRISKPAVFGTRNFHCKLEDGDGDLLDFIGYFNYKIDSEGLQIESYDYWPKYPGMVDSIVDYIRMISQAFKP